MDNIEQARNRLHSNWPVQTDYAERLAKLGVCKTIINAANLQNAPLDRKNPEHVQYFIVQWLPYAKRVADTYYHKTGAHRDVNISFDDVLLAAFEGLARGADCFHRTAGDGFDEYSFGPYIFRWLKKYCLEFINTAKAKVSMPKSHAMAHKHAEYQIASIDQNWSTGEEHWNPIMSELQAGQLSTGSRIELAETLAKRKNLVTQLLSSLDSFELQVVNLHFGLTSPELTAKEIAQQLNCRITDAKLAIDNSLAKMQQLANSATVAELESWASWAKLGIDQNEFSAIVEA